MLDLEVHRDRQQGGEDRCHVRVRARTQSTSYIAHEEKLKPVSLVFVSALSGLGVLQKLGFVTELTHTQLRSW